LFTQWIFDTIVTGSRLEGGVKFVRFLSPQLHQARVPARPHGSLVLSRTHAGGIIM
jgi:hypothetical protein